MDRPTDRKALPEGQLGSHLGRGSEREDAQSGQPAAGRGPSPIPLEAQIELSHTGAAPGPGSSSTS